VFEQGLRLMAESSLRTEAQKLTTTEDEAEYDGLMELEAE
jgi:hypothetical protein